MTYPLRDEVLRTNKLTLTLPQDLKNVNEKPVPKTLIIFEVASFIIVLLVLVAWIIVATAFLASHSPAKDPIPSQKGGGVHAYGTNASRG